MLRVSGGEVWVTLGQVVKADICTGGGGPLIDEEYDQFSYHTYLDRDRLRYYISDSDCTMTCGATFSLFIH